HKSRVVEERPIEAVCPRRAERPCVDIGRAVIPTEIEVEVGARNAQVLIGGLEGPDARRHGLPAEGVRIRRTKVVIAAERTEDTHRAGVDARVGCGPERNDTYRVLNYAVTQTAPTR